MRAGDLSRAHETELVIRSQLGCVRARNELVTAHMPMIRAIAHREAKVSPVLTQADLEGWGVLAMIRAIETFAWCRMVRLNTYARRAVTWQMRRAKSHSGECVVRHGIAAPLDSLVYV